MRLGHDPNFKFIVSRAIYKAVLRHLSAQYNTDYVVAPLPVNGFATAPTADGDVKLSWHPTTDTLEITATPTAYVVYTREGENGFDNGRVVTDTTLITKQKQGVIYSYRVTAINAGGESFPSEILSVCQRDDAIATAMVVNGFDRLAAPECREDGFHNEFDSGVAYIKDVAFIGEQRVYDVTKRRERVEQKALGVSYSDYEGKLVGGNSFDYPYAHGVSLLTADCSFYSSSVAAVERGEVDLKTFDIVDIILGKQRTTTVGRGVAPAKYQCFTADLQSVINDYLKSSGALIISGAYIGTDLYSSGESRNVEFAEKSLHFSFIGNCATKGSVATTASRSPIRLTGRDYHFCRDYRPDYYTVNSVDGLAATDGATALMHYPDSRLAAAVGYKGDCATFVMSFPFESITDSKERDLLMQDIVKYLIH
jgi:hypothetical protein